MPPQKDSILIKYTYPLCFGLAGVGIVIMKNHQFRRPIWSGIQRHAGYGAIGALLGYYIDIYFQKLLSEREAVVKHYIELHPEDFVEKKRKYKEIFEEWYPVR